MKLTFGTKLGPYEVQELLVQGAWERYIGRDTRLQREVAVKVLPESFARDPERLHRFEQEARIAPASRSTATSKRASRNRKETF